MVSSLNYALASLPNIYDQNNANLGATLQQLESGKNFQSPSDDMVDYFRSQDLNTQYDEYSNIKKNLTEWQGVMSTTSTAAGEVYNDLQSMKQLTDGYATADAPTQAADTAQYNALSNNIGSLLDSTQYGGTSLLWNQGALTSINLVPGSNSNSQSLTIGLGQVIQAANYYGLSIGGGQNVGNMGNAVNAALADAQGFIGKVSAYQAGIQSNLNITNSTMQNLQSFSSTLTNIDAAQVMTTYTQQEILQQAGAAILSQANMDQRNVLMLYQFPSSGA
jgi:flagellin